MVLCIICQASMCEKVEKILEIFIYFFKSGMYNFVPFVCGMVSMNKKPPTWRHLIVHFKS